MTLPPDLIRLLRNTPVREIVRALERDGFTYRRSRGSSRVYRHPDGTGAWLCTTTVQMTRCPLALYARFSAAPDGLQTILSDSGLFDGRLRSIADSQSIAHPHTHPALQHTHPSPHPLSTRSGTRSAPTPRPAPSTTPPPAAYSAAPRSDSSSAYTPGRPCSP